MLEKALRDEVGKLKPVARWAQVDAPDIDIWRRDQDVWTQQEPPEDHALPPILPWSSALHDLAIAVYRLEYDYEFEKDGRSLEITWPPTGNLSEAGTWYEGALPECTDHWTEYEEFCEECRSLDRNVPDVVDEHAQWDWTVRVEVLDENGQSVSDSDWMIGSTLVDPREVEYGPSRHHPNRQFLYMARRSQDL